MQYAYVLMYLKIDLFFNFVPNFKFKFWREHSLDFLGSFDMLLPVLQANHFEKISLILIFSLVDLNMT